MEQRLARARAIVAVSTVLLVPAALLSAGSRVALALAVVDSAVLAVTTAYAVFIGIYRYPH